MFDMTSDLWWGAVVGALLPDALRIAKGRHRGLPGWLGSIGFWVGLLVMVGLGILAVAITENYLQGGITFVTALGLAYAAPDFFTTLVSSQGSQEQTIAAGETNLLDWWAR